MPFRKFIFVALAFLLFFSSTVNSDVSFYESSDPMSDEKSGVVYFKSENYGRYRQQEKGMVVYRCRSGKVDLWVETADFVGTGKYIEGIEYRIDKDPMIPVYASKFLSRSTDGKAKFIVGYAQTRMVDNLKKGNVMYLRNYDYRNHSDVTYEFKLNGSTAAINKANMIGGCN